MTKTGHNQRNVIGKTIETKVEGGCKTGWNIVMTEEDNDTYPRKQNVL